MRRGVRRGASAGFTLLEVMLAVFVLATVVGALITMVQANLERLAEARRELLASGLAQQRAEGLLDAGLDGELPDPGLRDGRFPEPNDDLIWEESIEPAALPLPDDWSGGEISALFESPPDAPRPATAQKDVMNRVSVRAYPESREPESAAPFVFYVVKRAESPDPQAAQSGGSNGGASGQDPGDRP